MGFWRTGVGRTAGVETIIGQEKQKKGKDVKMMSFLFIDITDIFL